MRFHLRIRFAISALVVFLAIEQSHAAAPALVKPAAILIHLPGVGGELAIDHRLVGGLIAGGAASVTRIIDWTGTDRGLNALGNVERHHQQAALVAQQIIAAHQADPDSKIILTAHSGGTGIAIWALEDLPPTMKIDTLVLLASALSPTYDLSKALSHVNGQALSFYSENDELVLGLGTRAFGTIDRVQTNAAGYVGFTQPPQADPIQYAKFRQIPYDVAWMKLGNAGDHIGSTSLPFAAQVLAPMISGRRERIPATAPALP